MKMPNKLQIVIDTNVLLVSISEYSKYHGLFLSLLNDEFDILLSNEILLEYTEVITNKMGETTANNTLRTLKHHHKNCQRTKITSLPLPPLSNHCRTDKTHQRANE